jgi:hypothetical protein
MGEKNPFEIRTGYAGGGSHTGVRAIFHAPVSFTQAFRGMRHYITRDMEMASTFCCYVWHATLRKPAQFGPGYSETEAADLCKLAQCGFAATLSPACPVSVDADISGA